MIREIMTDTNYTKTYANKKNMERAISKLNVSEDLNLRYITKDDNGRVTPVFILDRNTNHLMHYFIHNGFMVVIG